MTNHIETARAALLKIWPDGVNCQHAHAHDAFAALDAAQEQVAALPADWRTDSSLETWFPRTAEELTRLRAQIVAATSLLREVVPILNRSQGCAQFVAVMASSDRTREPGETVGDLIKEIIPRITAALEVGK